MMSREWSSLPPATRASLEEVQAAVPVKLSALARLLGLTIKSATLAAGISGEIRPDPANPGRYVIRVNRHDSPERQRFTIAHEIGHFLLHREQIGDGITDDVLYRSTLSDRREAEANRIAADILMPDRLINQALDRAKLIGVDDVPEYLARQFEVSDAAMKIRLGLK
ncbi:ImmA/IrrE family metallo-endopeptidase [Shinella zoogloeoides]|uniref:ImmA/IrrE family metallo-endopeptidase n=1 Tax=Shinella zoogloeoides TaxID=352475 RepID=UPI000E65AB79|nr:ImmA/IrrE family metallo-endopeptidase [Shinella zoogloeoides]